jgi:hypothetical protein
LPAFLGLPITYIVLLTYEDDCVVGEDTADCVDGEAVKGGAASGTKAIKILRMLRLAKLLRVFRFKRLIHRYDDLLRPVINGMKISGLSLAIIFIAHLVGCLWYYAGSGDQIMADGSVKMGWTRHFDGWEDCDVHSLRSIDVLPDGSIAENKTTCMPAASTWNQYLTALYWAATTVTTVGYGDISATTDVEMMFSFVAMIFGVMIFATVSGTLTTIVMSSKAAETVYNQRMDGIRQYLVAKKVPLETRQRVITFYKMLWAGAAVYDEHEILGQLPTAIAKQVISHMYKEMIDAVRLFNNLRGENRDEILCKICLGLRSRGRAGH